MWVRVMILVLKNSNPQPKTPLNLLQRRWKAAAQITTINLCENIWQGDYHGGRWLWWRRRGRDDVAVIGAIGKEDRLEDGDEVEMSVTKVGERGREDMVRSMMMSTVGDEEKKKRGRLRSERLARCAEIRVISRLVGRSNVVGEVRMRSRWQRLWWRL